MRIITTGGRYTDIDAYGSCIAYAELLNLQGQPAKAVTVGALNASVPPIVREWKASSEAVLRPGKDDTFTLIDISDPEFIDARIDPASNVDEVIDHHPGFEAFWYERIGNRSDIQPIGAACTLVYERWEAARVVSHMSQTSARLLMCGILDNTLNFGATITSGRDKKAYRELKTIAGLPHDWSAQYFTDCERSILADLKTTLHNDTKIMRLPGWKGPIGTGQIALWNGHALNEDAWHTMEVVLPSVQSPWFVNIISIGEGKNYLYCTDDQLKMYLAALLNTTFKDNLAQTNRLWLRKEIAKQAMTSHRS